MSQFSRNFNREDRRDRGRGHRSDSQGFRGVTGNSFRGRGRGGRPGHLRGRNIGLYYAQKQREKSAMNRDMIEISDEQIREIQKVNQVLDQIKVEPHAFGKTDYESDFMKAYKDNKLTNASKNYGIKDELSDDDEPDQRENIRVRIEKLGNEEPKEKMKKSARAEKLEEFRQSLPSYAKKDHLVQLVRDNNIVVISGETGCGKTTQVPQYLLEDSLERKSLTLQI